MYYVSKHSLACSSIRLRLFKKPCIYGDFNAFFYFLKNNGFIKNNFSFDEKEKMFFKFLNEFSEFFDADKISHNSEIMAILEDREKLKRAIM